jgi:hypothetical protein
MLETLRRLVTGTGTVTAIVLIIDGTAITGLTTGPTMDMATVTDPITDRTMATAMVIAPIGVPVSVCGSASDLREAMQPAFASG